MSRLSAVGLAAILGVYMATTAAAQRATASKPVWPDEGPYKWAPRRTVSDITANDLRTRLYQFADDSMMGRRIGEVGNFKGTAYIAREFKRLGLAPAGDEGDYFQNLPYGPLKIDSTASRLIAAGAPLSQKADWVPVTPTTTNGLGGKADVTNAPTVFAGRWGDTTSLDPAVFGGRIAVFVATPTAAGLTARATPPVLRCDSVADKFGADAAARVEARQRADSIARGGGRGGRGGGGGGRDTRAQQAGAVGILFVALDSAPRTAVSGAFNTRGAMQPPSPAGAPFGAAISSGAAATLFGKPIEQLTVGALGQPMTAQWRYDWQLSATPARNVIAVMRGADPARTGEYVLVSAHNDHVGTQVAVDHDSLRAVNMVTRRQGANDPVCRPTTEQQHVIDSLIARAR